jgi:hypothetical protein
MNAQFAVQRSRILLNPQAFYQEMLDFVMDSKPGCKCQTDRNCDQCVGLEPVWWMVFGEPIINMPTKAGAYDKQRLQLKCQGSKVRKGFSLTRELKRDFKRIDFVHSAAIQPYFMASNQ